MPSTVINPKHIYCVGEIGINHNGEIALAKELIRLAHEAGFDCVKFQKRTVEEVYTKEELDAPRESPWGKTNRDQKMGLEFGKDEYDEIALYCKKLGIAWTASPWDIDSVNFLVDYDIPFIKIASACATNKHLMKYCDARGLPLFVSTGGCDQDMIQTLVSWVYNIECLYHCCANYPAKLQELNISAINTLREAFPYIPHIGYSGHESGLSPSLMAAVTGAMSIERHITLNRAMYGSDQAASLEPKGFQRLIRDLRAWEAAKGDGVLRVLPSEVPVMEKLRKVDNT